MLMSCGDRKEVTDGSIESDETEAANGQVEAGSAADDQFAGNLMALDSLPFTLAKGRVGSRPNDGAIFHAYAIAQGRDVEGKPVTVWVLGTPTSRPKAELSLMLDQGDGSEREITLRSMKQRSGSRMRLYASKGTNVDCPKTGMVDGPLSAYCLIAGKTEEVIGAKKVDLVKPIANDNKVLLPDGIELSKDQHLLHIFNEAGELASIAFRASHLTQWEAQALPDLADGLEPVIGPFTMTASTSADGRGVHNLWLDIIGPLEPGLADEGTFNFCFGLKTNAQEGYDSQGRRFIANPSDLRSAKLKVMGFGVNEDGTKIVRPYAPLPADAHTVELVGQLFWIPRSGDTVPFAPMEIRLELTGGANLTVSGNDLFKMKEQEVTGKSESQYLSDARILDLKGEVIPNQTAVLGKEVVLAMKNEPWLQIYSFETSRLEALPTQIKGGNLLIGGREGQLCILDTKEGVIEKWDLAQRRMIMAGLVEKPQDVLGIGMVKGRPCDYIVMACREQLRFLNAVTLEPCEPMIRRNGRADGANWEIDDYRAVISQEVDLNYAVANQTEQGSLLRFRALMTDTSGKQIDGGFIVLPSMYAGAVRSQGFGSGETSMGPYGASYFRYNNVAYSRESLLKSSLPTWRGKRAGNLGSKVLGVFYPFPQGINLMLATSREKGKIPQSGFDLEVHDLGANQKDPISIGRFDELAGCTIETEPGKPHMSKHLFISPDGTKLMTLNDAGTRIYERDFKKQAVLDNFAGGNLMLKTGTPLLVNRGMRMAYQQDAAGVKNPEFKLLESPPGARLSKNGLLEWECPAEMETDSVKFVIQLTDSERNLSLENSFEVALHGPKATLMVKEGQDGSGVEPPLKIFEVPNRGIIVDKLELAQSRLQLLLTKTPEGVHRLELFDVETMSWRQGVELQSKPDAFTANPEVVYLCYQEKSVMELRSTSDLNKMKKVNLPLPLLGIGCSQDTTEGVLCLAERLEQRTTKLAEYIDWTGQRVTISESHGAHARFVFLSPMTLKPLPIQANEKHLNQIVSHLPRSDREPIVRFTFSSDGKSMSISSWLMNFEGGQLNAVMHMKHMVHAILEKGRYLYTHGEGRLIRTDEMRGDLVVYEATKKLSQKPVIIKPIHGLDVDFEYSVQSGLGERDSLSFCRRSDGQHLMTISAVDDLGDSLPRDKQNLSWHMASVHKNKLITVGNRCRQLFIRELDF